MTMVDVPIEIADSNFNKDDHHPDDKNNGNNLSNENGEEDDVKREIKVETEIEMGDSQLIGFDSVKENERFSVENGEARCPLRCRCCSNFSHPD